MEKGLVRSLEAINYRVFIGYESACSGFRLKRSNFPRHATGGVRFFRMCVQYINVCLRKKLIAVSACCGFRIWWRWSVVVVGFRVEYFLVFKVITLNSEKKHLRGRTTTTAPLPRIPQPVSCSSIPRFLSFGSCLPIQGKGFGVCRLLSGLGKTAGL